MLNRQLILDDVRAKLTKQGKRAINATRTCVYQDPDDPTIKCGIGHLITYDPVFDMNGGLTVFDANIQAALLPQYGTVSPDTNDAMFLNDVQLAHDRALNPKTFITDLNNALDKLS